MARDSSAAHARRGTTRAGGSFDGAFKLACPFHWHYPEKYRKHACGGGGWEKFWRLREHLKRNHKDELTPEQWEKLRKLPSVGPTYTPSEKWVAVVNIVFPKLSTNPQDNHSGYNSSVPFTDNQAGDCTPDLLREFTHFYESNGDPIIEEACWTESRL